MPFRRPIIAENQVYFVKIKQKRRECFECKKYFYFFDPRRFFCS